MYVKRVFWVNWGNLPNMEFELGAINLFSGGNGSGKTTAADAIQTVMTAAYDYLYTYNPGQDETSQRGRGGKTVRTLSSYILGCDDGSYARPHPTDGYIGLYFAPTRGESARPFTALVAARAHLDQAGLTPVARLDALHFYILPEVGLHLDGDLVVQDDAGKAVVPIDTIYDRLRRKYGTDSVEHYDTKKAYLKRLYGIVRGRRDSVSEREAMHAARAFSRFMAYKPVRSINEFVAHEILEKKDLGEAIRTVSETMKTIYRMEADARRLKESIDHLSQTRHHCDQWIAQWIDETLLGYALARRRYQDDQQRYLDARQRQQQLHAELKSLASQRTTLSQRHQSMDQARVTLRARRMGIAGAQEQARLEAERENLSTRFSEAAAKFAQAYQQTRAATDAAQNLQNILKDWPLETPPPEALNTLLQTLAEARRDLPEEVTGLMNTDWVNTQGHDTLLKGAGALQSALQALAPVIHDDDTGLVAQVRQAIIQVRQQMSRLSHQRQNREQELERLGQARASYPHSVQQALEVLHQMRPEADARVLCDYVDITEPAWQAAIEGYIGGARFGILVEPEHEAAAARLLREQLGRDSRARIIQGTRALQDVQRTTTPPDSIIHVMRFEHAIAEAYITVSYGQVRRVADESALRMTRRGVTASGLGSGNYSMFRCDLPDGDLVFGSGARQRARAAREADMHRLLTQKQKLSERLAHLERLERDALALRATDYADALHQLLTLQKQLSDTEIALTHLQDTTDDGLEARLCEVDTEMKAIQDELEALNRQEGALERELESMTALAKKYDQQQDRSLALQDESEENLRSIARLWPDMQVDDCMDQAARMANELDPAALSTRQAEARSRLLATVHDIERLVAHTNTLLTGDEHLRYTPDYADIHARAFFADVCDLARQADILINRLKNNVLVSKQEQISAYRESFSHAFVTNLCHQIYQAINEGKRTLENLNRELAHHRFGADRESFHFAWEWVPEFKAYWEFFEEVSQQPDLGEGQTLFNAELSPRARKIREQLLDMLLAEDEQHALQELARISDYRNYRNYEIYKQPEGKAPIPLSQYGTGSGGQLETPAYIIRAAAITSAFRFDEGDSHLRMVLVDEAFSKMDEHRSREVIQYLTDTLGLQLTFIMPTSKSGPFMDIISNQFVFSKVPASRPIGQLNTRVLVDRQVLDQEKVRALWEEERHTLRQQFDLDFMDAFE